MNPFSKRTLIALFSISIITFLLGLLLAAYGGDLFGERSAETNSYSRSLVGHHGFLAFLKASGIAVVPNRSENLKFISSASPLLLLEPISRKDLPEMVDFSRLEAIMDQAMEAQMPLVIALPKRRVMTASSNRSWISKEVLLPVTIVDKVLETIFRVMKLSIMEKLTNLVLNPSRSKIIRTHDLTEVNASGLGLRRVALGLEGDIQVLERDERITPLLECREGVLIGRISGKSIYIISDPDLFNNRGLDQCDHALVMLTLIRRHLDTEVVVVDETLHGFVSQASITGRAMSFPLVLIVIHGLLTLGLMIWAASQRFGHPRTPPPELPPGKELLIDNTSKLLLSGGNHIYALQSYLKLTLGQVARRFLIREGTSQQDLLTNLKNLTGSRGIPHDLDRIAEATRNRALTPSEALKTAKKIYQWRTALMGQEKRE